MNVFDLIEVKIVNYDKDGKGIAYIDDKICFIPKTLIDEICLIRITKITSKVILGELVKVIKKSSCRQELDCKYALCCGGCQLRHVNYDTELIIKENKVFNTLRHVSKLDDYIKNKIIKAENIDHYRNKAIIPFQFVDNDIVYGMYQENSHKIVHVDKCLIESPILETILPIVKSYLLEKNISIYDENTKKGIFRGIMLRNTFDYKYMLVFITTTNINLDNLVNKIRVNNEEIISYYLNINDMNNNVMLGYKNIHLYGKKVITENILGNKFEVSVNTFLQVNHDQTEKLYNLVLDKLNLSKEDNVLDCFCGMGSITLCAAKFCNYIYGIEVVESGINDARYNAKLNNVNNVEFKCGKCEDLVEEYLKTIKINKVILDPPRKGCEKSFLDALIKSKIETIIYVSCGINSLGRDLLYLKEFYNVVDVTPIDLFPRTMHVETVVLLSRKY